MITVWAAQTFGQKVDQTFGQIIDQKFGLFTVWTMTNIKDILVRLTTQSDPILSKYRLSIVRKITLIKTYLHRIEL